MLKDNEIIKALECCGRESCNGCPYDKNCHQGNPMIRDTLDLINRQQAEIERLRKVQVDHTKAVLYEFADRLQIRCIKQDGCLWSSDIGAELKEMVGEE